MNTIYPVRYDYICKADFTSKQLQELQDNLPNHKQSFTNSYWSYVVFDSANRWINCGKGICAGKQFTPEDFFDSVPVKHVHNKLIKQWADDTSLCVLKFTRDTWYQVHSSNCPSLSWYAASKYFLVCEKHVEVALAWLNGDKIECRPIQQEGNANWNEVLPYAQGFSMDIYMEYRIKPEPVKFIPKAGNWYQCELTKQDKYFKTLLFYNYDSCFDLPNNTWNQKDVTITGSVIVTSLENI